MLKVITWGWRDPVFLILGPTPIISGTVKARHFKFGVETDISELNVENAKLCQKRICGVTRPNFGILSPR